MNDMPVTQNREAHSRLIIDVLESAKLGFIPDSLSTRLSESCSKDDLLLIAGLVDEIALRETEHVSSNRERGRAYEAMKGSVDELERYRSVMLSILEDTNEAKIALEQTLMELRKTEQELVQAGKMSGIGQLAAGVAHEINNPLACISGYIQLMMKDSTMSDQSAEMLNLIMENTARCVLIIENLLNFARPRSVEKVPLDVVEIIEKTLSVLDYVMRTQDIKVVRQYEDAIPKINAAFQEMQQVFLNLFLNAYHAMPDGGELRISVYRDKGIKIKIEDTGSGMPQDVMDRMFEPFFTTSYGRGVKSTGLGLSISHSIIERFEGGVSVESEVGKGTTFVITFPIAKDYSAEKGQ